jgi:hypothetical protein
LKGISRFIFGTLLCCASVCAESPDWSRRGRPADSSYKYYVGRSSSASTEQVGFSEATREAYEQAIRENFGFKTRIQSDAYESSSSVLSTKRIQVLSEDIRVFGFEQVDSFSQVRNEKWDVWILYRYPLAEISREKSRLATQKKGAEVEFSEQGSASNSQRSGVLEIQTKPAGASVFVDGESYGVTPMRLNGVLAPGQHTLRLDHPSYAAVDEKVILVPGQVTKVDKTLVPARAKLALTTEPSNANVVINGKQAGTTPLPDLEVTANEPLKLEMTHAEANPFVTTLEVAKDEFNSQHFVLPLKPASLMVRTQPSGAEVSIGQGERGFSPLGPKSLNSGKVEVRIRKPGFQQESISLVLRGGEKRILEISLTPSRPSAEPAVWAEYSQPQDRKKLEAEAAVLLSAWLPQFRSGSSTYPSIPLATVGVSTTLLFESGWGLEFGYAYGARGAQFADSRLLLTMHRIHLAVPIFFRKRASSHFYLGPELDFVLGRYQLTFASDGIQRSATTQNQLGYGFIGGYRSWWAGWGLGLRVGLVNQGASSATSGALSYLGGLECFSVF